MELDTLLKELTQKYAFTEVNYKVDEDQSPNLEVCFHLTKAQIEKVISKAGRMDDFVSTCANMVQIFDSTIPMELLLQTTVRCAGKDQLIIRTVEPMLKLLAELIFG